MLTILDRYIIKKFLGTFLFSILIIISIAIVFDTSEKIDDFIENDAKFWDIVIRYYLNFIPYFANLFSSLFIFISVIFFTSKMASDTEIIAILSSGVSFKRLMFPYFVSAFLLALLSFFLSNYIIPEANKVRYQFMKEFIFNKEHNNETNIHKQLEPGIFIYMESYSAESKTGYKFSIEKFDNSKLVSKLISDNVVWDSTKNKWQINNYYIRTINKNDETITKGKSIDTTLNIKPSDFTRRLEEIETMTLPELNSYIAEQKLQGAENIEKLLIQKYQRFAFPFSTFILTLIGVSIASRKTKGGIGMHIGLGILLSFSYILFMQVSTNLAIGSGLNSMVAVWIPNIFYLLIGIFLYRAAPK